MSLCSTLLLTNHGIILMDEKNTAFYNVIIKTNHQSDNSFFRGKKKYYIIHTNPYKTPNLENFKWENGKRICLRIKAIWCLPRTGNIAFSNICCFKKTLQDRVYIWGVWMGTADLITGHPVLWL